MYNIGFILRGLVENPTEPPFFSTYKIVLLGQRETFGFSVSFVSISFQGL